MRYENEKATLKGMGFGDEAAMDSALEQAQGNVERAATILLDKALEEKERARLVAESEALTSQIRSRRSVITSIRGSPTLRTASR